MSIACWNGVELVESSDLTSLKAGNASGVWVGVAAVAEMGAVSCAAALAGGLSSIGRLGTVSAAGSAGGFGVVLCRFKYLIVPQVKPKQITANIKHFIVSLSIWYRQFVAVFVSFLDVK